MFLTYSIEYEEENKSILPTDALSAQLSGYWERKCWRDFHLVTTTHATLGDIQVLLDPFSTHVTQLQTITTDVLK